jgi:hypothetical protein
MKEEGKEKKLSYLPYLCVKKKGFNKSLQVILIRSAIGTPEL